MSQYQNWREVRDIQWSRTVDAAQPTPRRYDQSGRIADAFKPMASVLTAEEYTSLFEEWERGERDIRVENGFLMMCYTPSQ